MNLFDQLTFGPERIRALMAAGSYTYATLADMLGVSTRIIFMWTAGERKPGLKAAARLLELEQALPTQ